MVQSVVAAPYPCFYIPIHFFIYIPVTPEIDRDVFWELFCQAMNQRINHLQLLAVQGYRVTPINLLTEK